MWVVTGRMEGTKDDEIKIDYVLEDPQQLPVKSITPQQYHASSSMQAANAIVIDLGSSALRAGYSNMKDPCLQMPPMVARMRDADTGIRTFLVGHDALISSARSTARPAYEAGIPNNPALMERLLDGTLVGLGLANEDKIDHKFLLTEAPCQPNSARALIMEILFEAYLTPGVSFGIDALFSYFYNRHTRSSNGTYRYTRENAVIVSCGYNSTHVLPLRGGRLDPNSIKRINVGGMHMTDQLTRRLQLLHPDHSNALTPPRVELLKEKACFVSTSYDSELLRLKQKVDYYNSLVKSVKIPLGDGTEKSSITAEEQERQRQARIENGKRLSEMMREKRRAKTNGKDKESGSDDAEDDSFTEEEVSPLYEALERWYELQRIQEMREIDEDKFFVALVVRKFETPDALTKELKIRLEAVSAEREKFTEAKHQAAEEAWWKKVHEDELLSMSDSELNATELKRKRHIRALRGAAEARDRAKRAKELEKAEAERKEAELRKMREEQPEEYLKRLRHEREVLAGRVKKRNAAREAGSDRRSLAARERMRLLAQHAGSTISTEEVGKGRARARTRTGNRGRARGRGRGKASRSGKKGKADEEEDDDFGWDDADWDVYRSMKVGGESDSEDNSAEERERLETVRREIQDMAPDEMDPTVSHPEGVALLYEPNKYADIMPICVDRMRTGEILFQPTLAGIEQCGLSEAIGLAVADRRSIVKEVFVTGGVGGIKGLDRRLAYDLRSMFPTELGPTIMNGVRVAKDPLLDAWRGAAMFAQTESSQFRQACISKADWEEMGNGYLKENAFSNVFYPTPVLSAADLELKKKMQKQSHKRGRNRGLVT